MITGFERYLAVAAGCLGLAGLALGQAVTFQGIADLQWAHGLSADGTVVLGSSPQGLAAKWSSAGGLQTFATIPGQTYASARGMSADGSVVVGGVTAGNQQAIRWVNGIPEPLGGRGALAVSADGQTIVGDANIEGPVRAVRWNSAGTMTPLPILPGSTGSLSSSVSASGEVAAGLVTWPGGIWEACIWTETECIGLGHLQPPGTVLASLALGISSDGAVVVGHSSSAAGLRAFRWTAATGMEALPLLTGGQGATASVVSGDGSVIAGDTSFAGGSLATFWTAQLGAVDLKGFLEAHGLNLAQWQLSGVQAISADGLTFVGMGVGPHGQQPWIATIPAPGAAAVICAAGLLAGWRRR